MDEAYRSMKETTEVTGEDRKKVESRLKMLGYIE
jgi:hypothetical protein